MNRMLDRLDHGQQQQRQFVSDAAHELRSTIASIKQNVEVAAAYPDQLSSDEWVGIVRAEATRLERLVVSLLSLARLDERSSDSSAVPVDLDDLVFDEAARLRKASSLRVEITGVSAGRVGGDQALLTQVLRNLVDNADRHASTTVALTLTPTEDETAVTLLVEDDGPGIQAEDRERVFGRFVRLDEAGARDDGGSGLGLAIVHTIVTAYDGSVAVDSSRLGGARFTVTLPPRRFGLARPSAVRSASGCAYDAAGMTSRRTVIGRWSRYVLGMLLAAGLIAVAVPSISGTALTAASSVILSVPALSLLGLVAMWILGLALHTVTLTAALPTLTHRRALTLSLSGSAVANALPLGGAAGMALNYRMIRGWGFGPS